MVRTNRLVPSVREPSPPTNPTEPVTIISSAFFPRLTSAEAVHRVIEDASTEELVARCLDFVQKMRRRLAPWVAQRMDAAYGPMPNNDPGQLSFWMALVSSLASYL